jgi:hypothetical protein
MNDANNPQKKLLNYLIFGHLSKCLDKSEYPPFIGTSSSSQQTTKLPQTIRNNREASLENLLAELSLESEEVTFSQIIVQFLKLNSRFEHASTILDIIVTIVKLTLFFKKF